MVFSKKYWNRTIITNNIKMIPTIDDIILASGIHRSRVFNIYLFGSRVYGTFNTKSDWDIIMVANNSVEAIEIKGDEFNIHVYTPDKFKSDLEWHRPNNLECIFAPDFAKLLEKIDFSDFKINLIKLRHATSHVSSYSWVKAKKKLEAGEYFIGIKSLYHSLRIPMFSNQIIETGRIVDFTCANSIWDKISQGVWSWEELDSEFRGLRNKVLTEFRSVTTKN